MNIYYKTKVEEYNNKNCFLIYFKGLGIFINTPDRTFKIFEKEFYNNSIDELEIDEYARTREFETVVKFWRPENLLEQWKLEWYNDFDKNKDNLKILKNRLLEARKYIHKYTFTRVPHDKITKYVKYELSIFIYLLSELINK